MATNRIIVLRYQSLTSEQYKQLQELNGRYVSKQPVIIVDEQYRHIAVASDNENVFEEVRKTIMQLKIMGLRIEWMDEGDPKELLEQELLAKLSDTGKIN